MQQTSGDSYHPLLYYVLFCSFMFCFIFVAIITSPFNIHLNTVFEKDSKFESSQVEVAFGTDTYTHTHTNTKYVHTKQCIDLAINSFFELCAFLLECTCGFVIAIVYRMNAYSFTVDYSEYNCIHQ